MRAPLVLLLALALAPPAPAVELVGLSSGSYSVPVTSIKERRTMHTILQQTDFSCGSAAVATLLTHHYGFPVSEQAVFAAMYAQGDQAKIRKMGFSMLDMKQFLERQGFQADGFEKPLDALATARLPAIVLLRENGYNHFVVVKGLRAGRVLIGDPAKGLVALARGQFEAMWFNRLLFVIHNRTSAARFDADADWSALPQAPLAATAATQLRAIELPKLGPGDF